jgi:DNA-binding transcriptional ArsR family regulator
LNDIALTGKAGHCGYNPVFHFGLSLASGMETKHVLAALSALAQESRLAIFRLLIQAGPEGMHASRIGEALQISSSALSFHLKELTHASLVTPRQEGRFVIYTAQFDTMNALLGFLTENCCAGADCGLPTSSCAPAVPVNPGHAPTRD